MRTQRKPEKADGPRYLEPRATKPMITVSSKASRPVAPPVYRPQPVPKVLQRKTALPPSAQPPWGAQAYRAPAEPRVYRPQPVPKVLQLKETAGRQSPAGQKSRAPVAPPVYRPQPVPRVLQAKQCGPGKIANPRSTIKTPVAAPVYRPVNATRVLQRHNRQTAAWRAAPNSMRVIQRAEGWQPKPHFSNMSVNKEVEKFTNPKSKAEKIFETICNAANIPPKDQKSLYKRFFTSPDQVTKTAVYEAVAAYYAEKHLKMTGLVRGDNPSWDLQIKGKKGIEKWDVKTPMIPSYEQVSEYVTQDDIDNRIAREEASSINEKQHNKGQLKEDRSDIKILLDTSYITAGIRDKIFAILEKEYGYSKEQLATIRQLRY